LFKNIKKQEKPQMKLIYFINFMKFIGFLDILKKYPTTVY